MLPERIWLFVFTEVVLRCGEDDVDEDDDERVALVVRPERMSLFGCSLRCVVCVPGAPRLAPAARVASDAVDDLRVAVAALRVAFVVLLVVVLLSLMLFSGCEIRPRVAVCPLGRACPLTADERAVVPMLSELLRSFLPDDTPVAVVCRRP